MNTHVPALILAGGAGTRLRSVVADRPKVIATVNDRPFLAFLLDQLHEAGVREAVLCTGYLGDQIYKTFGDSYQNMTLRYSRETAPLGTGGALRLAMPLLNTHAKPDVVLALNGDSFVDADIPALIHSHRQRGAAISLVVRQVPDTQRYGRVELLADDSVASFQEKGATAGEGWINAGIYAFNPQVIEHIPDGKAVSLEREVLPAYCGRRLLANRTSGRFIDIGTPETYAAAVAFFAAKRSATSSTPPIRDPHL